ncbi:protein tyrosine phosphatase [Scheffersomyces stipitis CBS 6054]|uniref:protein-tyrosine-phosphatase n=1 Tax=Scheffersomyces stipitis (strain ATCC 58785 / CBS 6054 / NBRC 10063 / NRRL Y-11545) TaxID=322104 RepID=A3GI89_PICST|nr:protein tyrosine phosphatase [Scheffersomyces stipitis CBS 6054]EAZ62946.2 protein tyrosine phosphatase [Scheffersomyces stipitis CBS 6054]
METMSSSPSICASPNFTFPSTPSKQPESTDYFNKSKPSASPKYTSTSTARQPDYFRFAGTMSSPTSTPVASKPSSNATVNDSIGSITSNTSDLTIYETSSRRTNDSRETLVDEENAETRKIPKYKHNHTASASGGECHHTLLSFNEVDEYAVPKMASAIESSFPSAYRSGRAATSAPLTVAVPPSMSARFANPPSPSTLKKQITLPSLSLNGSSLSLDSVKSEQMKRLSYLPSQNYKQQIEKLNPDRIKYFSLNDITIPTNDEHVLVIDIRPFTDFAKSHITNALNICLPSTLLKRPNFTLIRCINSLPNAEKVRFNQFLSESFNGIIVLYDSMPNSSNLFHMVNKFINCNVFMESKHQIHLVDSSIHQFAEQYPSLFDTDVTSASSANVDSLNNYLPPIIVTEKYRSHSVSDLSPCQRSTPTSSSIDKTSTPILSNFSLPKPKANIFKLRHNEDLANSAVSSATSSASEALSKNAISLFKLKNLPDDRTTLPKWIRSTVVDGTKINDDFYSLEKFEQKRLISALTLQRPNSSNNVVLSPLAEGEVAPTISCGIEYGHKNRYKDIFLYEHSRVKLNDSELEEEERDTEDYINASYLNPIQTVEGLTGLTPKFLKHLKYIATQGPMEETMGDFWKVIINLQIPIIISLTDEIENGVMKCSPFWKSGVYKSNKSSITLRLQNSKTVNDYLIMRSFDMTMTDAVHHKVLQLQLLSWPDMGTVSTPVDIIQLIQLKSYLLDHLKLGENCEYPTAIHCSAGCGRTGTLCTIDTIINILKNNHSTELLYDPVYNIVNNFRKQRISMVQNLRQYFLIYEVLLHYLNNGKFNDSPSTMKSWNELIDLDIIQEFISGY